MFDYRHSDEYFKSKNGDRMYQNLGNVLKAVLLGKFMALKVCVRKGKMSQICYLRFYLKDLEKKAKKSKQAEERK